MFLPKLVQSNQPILVYKIQIESPITNKCGLNQPERSNKPKSTKFGTRGQPFRPILVEKGYVQIDQNGLVTYPRWTHAQPVLLHKHPCTFETLASFSGISRLQFYRLKNWERPGNEAIVVWGVCKCEKVVLWNTSALYNSHPQCTVFP